MNNQIVTKLVSDPEFYQLAMHRPTRSIALLLPFDPEVTRARDAYALVPLRAYARTPSEDDIRLIKARVGIESPSIKYVRPSDGRIWRATITLSTEIRYNDPCEMFARAIDDARVRERIWEDAGVHRVQRVYTDADTARLVKHHVRGARCANVRPLKESQ